MKLYKNKILVFASAFFLLLQVVFVRQVQAQSDYPSCVAMGLGADVCSNMFPDGAGRSGGSGTQTPPYTDYASCVNYYYDQGSSNPEGPTGECCRVNAGKNWSQCSTSNPNTQVPPPAAGSGTGSGAGTGAGAGSGAGAGNPANPNSGVNTSTSAGCPAGYEKASGLCIPQSPFKGGLTDSKTLPELVLRVLTMLLTFAGVVAVVIIIVGGFQYMTSGGNDEQAEKGKKALTNAIIGLVVVILAYAIVQIITNTLTKQVVF